MVLRLFLCLVAALALPAHAQSLPDAFNQGATLGRSGNAAARGQISGSTAQSTVPNYTTTPPEASYFGSPGLGTQSSARVGACAGGPGAAGGFSEQDCNAIDFSQTNPTVHPQFNLQPSDPVFANTKAILNDPAAVAGNITGTYSGCTTETVKNPDIFQTQFCNSYRALEQPTCSKTLTVTVTDNGLNCTYGAYLTPNPRIAFIRPFVFVGAICAEDIRFQWIWGYSECNGTDAPQYRATIMPSDAWQVVGVSLPCGGNYNLWGSCPGGNCSYAVGWVYDSFVCDQYDYSSPSCDDSGCSYSCLQGHNETVYSAIAGFNWQRPVHTYTITDAWNNQCATYEARLP